MKIITHLNRYRFLIILIISLICASNVKWGGQRWKEIIAFDGKGYYAYLPAVFIYQDLQYTFLDSIEEKYSGPNTHFEIRVVTPQGTIDKYFCGTAFAQLPFFIVAHLLTKLTGGITDGYSFIYQICINLAGIIYALIGLLFLKKILRKYSFSESIISIVIFAIFFGTQLFYYSIFDPSYSHVYSFAIITAFIFFLKKYTDNQNGKDLILLGVLLAIIILIRPVNGLIIFIFPFLAGNRETTFRVIKNLLKYKTSFVIATALFILIISLQFLFYYLQTGKLFIDSYVVESFLWNRPEIINILFSYKKGLFIYTPLTLIAMAGLIPLYHKSHFSFWWFIIFFLTITYVFSCWWIWWYGGSFSARPYTEFLSLFAILLAFFLSKAIKMFNQILIYSLIVFCIILCQVQIYQFRYYIIHWEKMDKEHYWRVFMRIDQIIKQENPNSDLLKK